MKKKFLTPEKIRKIPTGHYCYGYVLPQNSRFRTMAEADEYLDSLSVEKHWEEWEKLNRAVNCPYLKYIGHGRVRCSLLGIVAVVWSRRSEHYAEIFYRKHPNARDRETGFLIGDAVKECRINRGGRNFSFLSD